MVKKNKQKIYTLFIVAVSILFIVMAVLDNRKITGVEQITFGFSNYDYSVVVTDSSDVDAFMEVINSASNVYVIEEDSLGAVFTINFIDSTDKQYTYQFYRDENDQTVYYINTEENSYLSVPYTQINALLLSDNFDILYTANTPKELIVIVNNTECNIKSSNYTWYYRKIDDLYYNVMASESMEELPLFSVTSCEDFAIPEIPEAQTITVSVCQENKMLFEAELSSLKDFVPQKSGIYDYYVEVQYAKDSLEFAYGTVEYQFQMEIELQPCFKLSTDSLNSGEVIFIYAKYFEEDDEISVQTNMNFTPQFFKADETTLVALLPLSYYREYGTYQIDLVSKKLTESYSISIQERGWEIQNLTVDSTVTSNTYDSAEANNEFYSKIEPIQLISDDEKYFTGVFIQPVEGTITTDFGSIRYVNGAPTSIRHGAIDIAAPGGTPVKASNAGRVVFAEYLQMTGNTVIIEHGFGIKSWYYHMESLSVSVDDRVKQGHIIGKVGTTGFSTGNHLHFGMSVNNVWINPWTAFETEMLSDFD